MQQTLFEKENINLPPNQLFIIARVSGCLLSDRKEGRNF